MNKIAPISELQRVTAHYCEQPVRVMTNGETCKAAVYARQVAMYVAVVHLKKSKSEVARRFNVDRTTVYHGVKRVCKSDALWQKAMAVKALLNPVDIRDNSPMDLRNNQEYGKEHSGNKQEERLAA